MTHARTRTTLPRLLTRAACGGLLALTAGAPALAGGGGARHRQPAPAPAPPAPAQETEAQAQETEAQAQETEAQAQEDQAVRSALVIQDRLRRATYRGQITITPQGDGAFAITTAYTLPHAAGRTKKVVTQVEQTLGHWQDDGSILARLAPQNGMRHALGGPKALGEPVTLRLVVERDSSQVQATWCDSRGREVRRAKTPAAPKLAAARPLEKISPPQLHQPQAEEGLIGAPVLDARPVQAPEALSGYGPHQDALASAQQQEEPATQAQETPARQHVFVRWGRAIKRFFANLFAKLEAPAEAASTQPQQQEELASAQQQEE